MTKRRIGRSLTLVYTAVLTVIAACTGGCIHRTLTVTSNPPGALVTLNDQEIGRTPFTHDFTWYGKYDIALRKDGYSTRKYADSLIAPWWQWVPFDCLTDLLPLTDAHHLDITLHPTSTQSADPNVLLSHAAILQKELRSP